MNANRIEILHVSNDNHVFASISHNVVLYFFPSLQRFVNNDLNKIVRIVVNPALAAFSLSLKV